MYVIAATYASLAIVIFVAFVSEPSEVEIVMDDDHISVDTPQLRLNNSAANSDDQFFNAESMSPAEQPGAIIRRSLASQASSLDGSNPRIGFCEALKTPNVVYWGLCFFCIKFAVYSLLLWMPLFLD